jgi:UDP-N-acetylmuramate dehydrogenase
MHKRIINFQKYSSIKIGQPVEILMIEKDDIIPKDKVIIGGANNLLVSPNPPPLMMLSKDFNKIYIEDDMLYIGASTKSGQILSYVKKHNIGGFEFLSKLPGTLGGILAMNAGVKEYEIFNILDSVKINNIWIKADNIDYGYRYALLNGIVTMARFKLKGNFDTILLNQLISLRSNQPKEPSAGSIFKNPTNNYAGKLIEDVGLKGYQKGDMQISNIHSNFLINLDLGIYDDAIYIINLIEYEVKKKFNINLKREIKIL